MGASILVALLLSAGAGSEGDRYRVVKVDRLVERVTLERVGIRPIDDAADVTLVLGFHDLRGRIEVEDGGDVPPPSNCAADRMHGSGSTTTGTSSVWKWTFAERSPQPYGASTVMLRGDWAWRRRAASKVTTRPFLLSAMRTR